MSRRSVRLARLAPVALALAALVLPVGASATPQVKLKVVAVPIPKNFASPNGAKWPGTGNILGHGAAAETEYKISGTEYQGYPDPVIGINFWLPQGTVLEPQSFKTCPEKYITEEKAPEKCQALGAAAGPVGKVYGEVSFGKTKVPEEGTVESFFGPNNKLLFWTFGHEPSIVEVPSVGQLVHLGGSGGFGPELTAKIPLVATVPFAPYASVLKIKVLVGAAHMVHGKLVSYGRLPSKCPKTHHNHLLVKSEVIFAENGEESRPLAVPVSYEAPCPRKA